MSLPRYSHYRNSGDAWLSAIPRHWKVTHLRWMVSRNDGGVWGDEPDGDGDIAVLRSTDQTVRGEWHIDEPAIRKLSPGEASAGRLEEGDLLVTKSSGSALHIGKTTIVTAEVAALDCCFSNFMQRLRLRPNFLPRLAWYLLNSDVARNQFDVYSNTTTGLANLSGGIIGRVALPVPPADEQLAIVGFLDSEIGKIDALEAEQEMLIALLKEKRHAVISHAVTKGLNSDAPMKPSGIEWLGDVPAHWHVIRLGHIFRESIAAGGDGLPILSVSIHEGVSDKELDEVELDRKVTRSEDRSKYKAVQPGDLAYNMMRAWQGGFGAVTVLGQVSPAYVVARPKIKVRTEFIEQILRSPKAIEQMRRYSRGITDFRLRLYWEEFKSLSVAIPPLAEQDAILTATQRDSDKFDALSKEADKLITLLKEHRGALISAAVTGQIDVRELASAECE